MRSRRLVAPSISKTLALALSRIDCYVLHFVCFGSTLVLELGANGIDMC